MAETAQVESFRPSRKSVRWRSRPERARSAGGGEGGDVLLDPGAGRVAEMGEETRGLPARIGTRDLDQAAPRELAGRERGGGRKFSLERQSSSLRREHGHLFVNTFYL